MKERTEALQASLATRIKGLETTVAFGAPEIPDLFAEDAEALARTLLDRFYPARAARKAAAPRRPRPARWP